MRNRSLSLTTIELFNGEKTVDEKSNNRPDTTLMLLCNEKRVSEKMLIDNV